MTSHRPPARAALAAAISVAIALAGFPASGSAQTPAVAPPPVVFPKLNCGEKSEHPGGLASERQQRQWRKEVTDYLECYKDYVNAQKALANRYTDAANALIDQYNTAVKEMQAAVAAAAQ